MEIGARDVALSLFKSSLCFLAIIFSRWFLHFSFSGSQLAPQPPLRNTICWLFLNRINIFAMVKEIPTDAEFRQILHSNPGKLIVVDYTAVWCAFP